MVLTTKYPKENETVAMMYVHTRNKYYVANGIDVTVLNFGASQGYEIDGVNVITKEEFRKSSYHYDILVSHSPNLKHHYLFLNKYAEDFGQMVFFFHGHEVLKRTDIYPPPYPYVKQSRLSFLNGIYDTFKLGVWNRFFSSNYKKCHFVFVSQWMGEMFGSMFLWMKGLWKDG